MCQHIEREIERQHIDVGGAQETDGRLADFARDEHPNRVGRQPARLCHAPNLQKGRLGADVGIESTLAGYAFCLFSETSAAAVT